MNYFRILIDGLVLTGLTIGAPFFGSPFVHVKNCDGRSLFSEKVVLYIVYLTGLIFTALEVYLIYRGQENSDLFFWHPYLAWTISNMLYAAWYVLCRLDRGSELRVFLFERLVLWQVVVNTVFAGFALSVGWLMKLYVR